MAYTAIDGIAADDGSPLLEASHCRAFSGGLASWLEKAEGPEHILDRADG
jgi:hypothetical protein